MNLKSPIQKKVYYLHSMYFYNPYFNYTSPMDLNTFRTTEYYFIFLNN